MKRGNLCAIADSLADRFYEAKILISNKEIFNYIMLFQLTKTLTKDGGTFNPSGIIIEPKFCLFSKSKTLNQSMLKIVSSPGSSNTIVSSTYSRNGSKL